MRIAIVGPGALGCLLATYLHRGVGPCDSFYLVDHDRERAEAIEKRGLRCEHQTARTTIPVRVHSSPEALPAVDAVLFCVKSHDAAQSIAFCRPLLRRDVLPVFFQNGIGHLHHRRQLSTAAAVFATTTEGATSLGPGRIRHAGRGETFLGFLDDHSERAAELLDALVTVFERGALRVRTSSNIRERLWAKLFINAAINALTAIHDCHNGDLLEIAEARETMAAALTEAVRVAACEGIAAAAPLAAAQRVCRATADNVSSMLQDIRKRRKTEIDAINGAIVSLAEKHGLAAPHNRDLVHRVRTIEARYL